VTPATPVGSPSTAELPASFGHPLVIGHRGAPGYLPEHTLVGYQRAVEMGADYIEPDLVITRDGHLVARHEHELGGSTNVAEVFPDRRSTRVIEGRSVSGWFSEDFSLAEVKSLRARQVLDTRSSEHDDLYAIPTFQEVLDLVKTLEVQSGRRIGVYPETKHPGYFDEIGLSLEEPLLEQLTDHGYQSADAPVFIQSFEEANLRELDTKTNLRLVQLLRPRDLPMDLASVATYADGIGIHKSSLLTETVSGVGAVSPELVNEAHAAGLLVHVYTFRDEPRYLASSYAGDPVAELQDYFDAGVDGVFSDFSDTAVRARSRRESGAEP
jgi:glycerophosphoryl diester phosphodiesterase